MRNICHFAVTVFPPPQMQEERSMEESVGEEEARRLDIENQVVYPLLLMYTVFFYPDLMCLLN